MLLLDGSPEWSVGNCVQRSARGWSQLVVHMRREATVYPLAHDQFVAFHALQGPAEDA